ncbi:pimeloyl-ACP methyl ester carboxylesterase [Kribbella steppae]|uniref:Pimeloyl-ACP methyl ester carboxylesterase n=1 Tax=Kribbella steppae TaxID=2512223 RepID=A0A4R2GYG4_9ACTN|nr:alpha/beta hydrolase [Kribbella steppae]TCO15646.1 pimeloyl-ACP methyl ester carboxylesterase [Kribbella steppae]
MTGVVDQCLWVSPSEVSPRLAETSAQRFARSIADRCQVEVIGLRVWGLGLSDPYDLTTEVAAVEQAAADLGWSRYHLVGFSAGATVAFVSARANPRAVRTVAGFEPATIGDDGWSPVETRWRRDLARVRQLVPRQRQQAFRRLLMAPGQAVPSNLPAPPIWDARTDRLEDVLADVGFLSADLAGVTQPALISSGALSNPRFARLAERLVDVLPHAESVLFEGCSHLAPPHRVARHQFADELIKLWGRG